MPRKGQKALEAKSLPDLNLSAGADFSTSTPHGLGDDEFPLREEFVKRLQKAACVASSTKRWKELTGQLVRGDPLHDQPPAGPLCSECYGVGRCRARFTAEQMARFIHNISLVKRCAAHSRSKIDLPTYLFSNEETSLAVLAIFVLLRDPEASLFYRVNTEDGRQPSLGSTRCRQASSFYSAMHLTSTIRCFAL